MYLSVEEMMNKQGWKAEVLLCVCTALCDGALVCLFQWKRGHVQPRLGPHNAANAMDLELSFVVPACWHHILLMGRNPSFSSTSTFETKLPWHWWVMPTCPKNPSLNHTQARVRILTQAHNCVLPINPKGNQKYIAAATKKLFIKPLQVDLVLTLLSLMPTLFLHTTLSFTKQTSAGRSECVKSLFHILTNKYWSITTNNV